MQSAEDFARDEGTNLFKKVRDQSRNSEMMRDRRPLSLANTGSPCGEGANIFRAANDNFFGIVSSRYDPLSGAVPSTCTSSGTNITDKTLVYDALGNISSKSDVGTYTYGSGTTLPHAVTSVTGSYLGLTNPVLGYDANGNMTCTSTAANCAGTIGRQATYTSFNMTTSVTQGTNLLCFAYDSEHARITQTATTTSNSCAAPGTSAVTTTYLNDPASGAIEEAVSQPGMALVWRDYVQADGHIVALRTSTYTGSGTRWGAADWGSFNWSATTTSVSVLYFTLDHLGSIAVVTNASGSVVERDSYDAWGKRRNANGTDVSTCSITSQTTRGFTNQEMMDAVCLVNLNARLYDPVLGRFLSADPVVQQVYDPQDLNRYTYVADNPLSLIDPTGNFFGIDDLIAAIVIAAEAVFDAVTAAIADFPAWFAALNPAFQGAIVGGVLGGLQAGISGGNILKGILIGGVSGSILAGAGNALGGYLGGQLAGVIPYAGSVGNFIGYGLVGGLVSKAEGGNFGAGFLAAGAGSLVGLFGKGFNPGSLIASAVIGGVTSVLGGGKFANGAITAAFAYAAVTCVEGGCEGNASSNDSATDGTQYASADNRMCDFGPCEPEVVVVTANKSNAFWNFFPVNDNLTSVIGCFAVCLGYSWTKHHQAYLEVGFGTPQIGISREWTKNANNILLGPAINVNYSLATSSMSLGSPYPASGGATIGSVDLSGGVSATYGFPLGATQSVASSIGNVLSHINPNTMPIGP